MNTSANNSFKQEPDYNKDNVTFCNQYDYEIIDDNIQQSLDDIEKGLTLPLWVVLYLPGWLVGFLFKIKGWFLKSKNYT